MALVINDRVKETSTTTGTGTFDLAGAVSGFESFVTGIGNSNTTYYSIVNENGEFEVGLGTVTDAATDTLSRDTIISSSNSDAAVNFSAGTKNVFCTLPASKAVILDSSDNIVANNGSNLTDLNASNVSSGTLASDRLPTVPTTKGGTGLTAIGTANQVLAVNTGATALEYQDITLTTINNNADNRVITGSNTADTLEAESTFTFDGTTVTANTFSGNLNGNVTGNVTGDLTGNLTGNTQINGDLIFYSDDGTTLAGTIANNFGRLEFYNEDGTRFIYFENTQNNIQIGADLVVSTSKQIKTNKISQSAGAAGDIEITSGGSGSVIIETGTNNEINVTSGLVDVTGNLTASGTITGNLFSGSGASLTSLNATNVASGTLASDRLPTVPTTKGGTGLTAIGTANQVLAVNGAGTALEYQTISADITGVTAGSGLTGGGSSGDVTLNVGAGTGIDVAADAISVDVSDFMTNGSNNRIVTATGTDGMNAEANLVFDGNLGVGTASPSQKLEVSGTGARIYITAANEDISMDASGNGQISIDGNGYAGAIALDADAMNLYTNSASRDIVLAVDENEILRAKPTGVDVTGDLMLDTSDATLRIKAGITGTEGKVAFTFNTDSTEYGTLSLPYDTRATTGLLLQSNNYPITVNSLYGINLDFNGSTKLEVKTSSVDVAANLVPGANDTYDLGASGNVWRNLYTGDLHLSNEAKEEGNAVDGTKGNWTIQEGAEHLYILNNKSGKKYRFKLEEM
jgi:hypothetical protein